VNHEDRERGGDENGVMSAAPVTGAERPAVVVAVCTFNRHEPLAVLLEALVANARRLAGRAAVGVVVVDDSPDGNARPVVERYADRFELGLTYRVSGRQNIARARNLALETAIGLGTWVAMTDDDCEPAPDWLESLFEVQRRTGGDAVTGILKRRVPPGSPRWLTEQPFLDLGLFEHVDDGQEVDCAATHNSMLSSRWLRKHPDVRFDPDFGVTGGEDPVFYRMAYAAGLRIHYSFRPVVYENEPASRATLTYQLRTHFWYGNSTGLTSLRGGASRVRVFLHGGKVVLQALSRPPIRLSRGKPPQFRYGLALALRGMGIITGPLGIRVRHK
jgi:succinoglycan biosynthesis protein ExoM